MYIKLWFVFYFANFTLPTVGSLSELASHLSLQVLNIPPAVYLHDRKINPKIIIPNPPPLVFGAPPFPPGELEPRLPLVLMEASHYLRSNHLKTEGLLRISCSMQLLEIVREAYDREQYLRLFDYGPHVSAGLIKLYYRSLPEPLISKRYYNYLNEKCKTPEGFKTLLTAHQRDGGLPYPSRVLLTRHLFPLLSAIAQHQAVNKMTPENLAICVSPSLLRSEDPLVDIGISRGPVCQLVKWGIENIDQFSKRLVRSGQKELNIKKDPEKLIALSDDDEKGVEGGKIETALKETKKPDDVELLSPVAPKPEAVKSVEEIPEPGWKGITRSQSQPAPPLSPIEGMPLSLQPALQLTNLNTPPPSEEFFIPPPLSERPTPHLLPTTSPIQTSFLPSTSTEDTAPSAVSQVPCTQSPDSISPGSAQVNTRRPSHSSPFMAKIDIDSSAVAKSVAKFQALAEAASMTPPLLPVRRASTVSGTLMAGWMAGQPQEAPMLESSNGTRTWRIQQVEHLQLPLNQRSGGEEVGVGMKGVAGVGGFGGRGLHKAKSELDLGGQRKIGVGVRVGVAEMTKGSSNSGIIGSKLNKSHNSTTTMPTKSTPTPSFAFSTTEKVPLGTLPVKPLVPRRARSTIDFRSSSSSSPSSTSTGPRPPPPRPPGRAHTTGRIGARNSIVEELRQLYEERARGVEVLVQVGKGVKGSNIVNPGGGGLVRPIPE